MTDSNLTIDTFAWIEIIRDSPIGRRALLAIDSADRCLTPAIVIAELAAALVRDGMTDDEIDRELAAVTEASDLVPIDGSIAIGASHALVELRRRAQSQRRSAPGLADGLVLATARLRRTSILTGDPHFEGLPETIWVA